MITLIFVVSFILFVMFMKWRSNSRDKVTGKPEAWLSNMSILFGVVFFLCAIILMDIIPRVATENIFDNEITMYQKENSEIEEDIDNIVREYMKHDENNKYNDLKPVNNPIALITLFPELQEDEIVKQEIELYKSNSEKLKESINQKNIISRFKWELYFGK